MKTTIEFLDELKSRNGGASDYAIAKILGITHQMVSKYRLGKDCLGDSTAIRVAELLEINPAIVVSAVHAERAKSDQEKAVWRDIFEKLGGVAASVVIGVAAFALPVQNVEAAGAVSSNNGYYVKPHPQKQLALPRAVQRPLFPKLVFNS